MVPENGREIVNIHNNVSQFKNCLIVNAFRLSQVGVVSYGSECPSHGVYGRVTEVKHWILFLAQGAEDSNCNTQIPIKQGILGRGDKRGVCDVLR